MSGVLRGLLAALGAVMGSAELAQPGRRRRHQPVSAVEKAHQRARNRKRKLDRLSYWEPLGITAEDRDALAHLRLQRGKAARRLARKGNRIGHTVAAIRSGRSRPEPAPLRLGNRIPRASRVQLLREEHRPVSGRQWKKLRKAARRQERAS